MKINSGPDADKAIDKPDPESYEWWYFDGLDTGNNLAFTIIFYEGNPFSSRYARSGRGDRSFPEPLAANFPALSISVYRNGKPIYYGFVEHHSAECVFGRERVGGEVGGSSFSMKRDGGDVLITLTLDQTLPGGDGISGTLRFSSAEWSEPLKGVPENNSDRSVKDSPDRQNGLNRSDKGQERHFWNLVQPKARVEGVLAIRGLRPQTVEVEGVGYHDHNTGLEPMKDSFSDWYWGRFHMENSTLVYYLMQLDNEYRHEAWLIGSNGEVMTFDGEVRLQEEGLNVFGLKSCRKLSMKSNGIQAFIQNEHLLDNGPFYQRFQSQLVLNVGDTIQRAEGITEYIQPDRIERTLFRPLVEMRIVYPDRKPHWVQRFPRLYRWTW